MIIGLIRHFKVDYIPEKVFFTADEFSKALENYEASPVIRKKILLKVDEWDICYCSTIPRAVETAQTIYESKIFFSDLIVEVPVAPFTKKNIKLPSFIWHLGGRIAWQNNHSSQPETRSETLTRIEKFLNLISGNNQRNILVVTHGFFMRVFTEELLKRGYKGKIDFRPENGKLYLFEKKNAG